MNSAITITKVYLLLHVRSVGNLVEAIFLFLSEQRRMREVVFFLEFNLFWQTCRFHLFFSHFTNSMQMHCPFHEPISFLYSSPVQNSAANDPGKFSAEKKNLSDTVGMRKNR